MAPMGWLLLGGLAAGNPLPACLDEGTRAAIAAVQAEAMRDDRAYRWTESLVLEVGSRPAGTPQEARARAWARRELAGLGLEAIREEAFEFTPWREVSASVAVVAPAAHALRVVALGGSPSTAGAITASVVRFDSLEALRAAPASAVEGRAVFLDVAMKRTRDRAGYKAAMVARRDGPALAAAKGARLFLLRSIGTDAGRHPHAGYSKWASDGPRVPAVAVSIADADLLARLLARGAPVDVVADVRTESAPGSSANVIAGLRAGAASRTRDTVVLAAHLDSWHVGLGAQDDASGVGAVLAAASLLKPHAAQLRRDVVVILFGAEELAIAGGHAYADRHGAAMGHYAAVESDLGTGRLWRLLVPDPAQPAPLDHALAHALAPLGIEASTTQAVIGGPDIEPMAAHGVRIYDLDPEATSYFDRHHTDEDTLMHVSAENLRQHAAALATFALVAGAAGDECAP